MSEIRPHPPADDADDGLFGDVIGELHRLFEVFRATPAPPPRLSDVELVAEIRRRAARVPIPTRPSHPLLPEGG
ncbi:hypothetical protein ACSNOI_26520 [Actinomadura kijaniata]|uniref:hypothetical protein n=1 Tax=Actinomadura kijaniata TaxID=46161 RepID=UPI003F1DFF87